MFWSREEEKINVFTHFVAVMLSLMLGVAFLYKMSRQTLDLSSLFASSIYVVFVPFLFLVSCIYHYAEDPILKSVCRRTDQIMSILFVPLVQWVLVSLFWPKEAILQLKPFAWFIGVLSLIAIGFAMGATKERMRLSHWGTSTVLLTGLSTLYLCWHLYDAHPYLSLGFVAGGVSFVIGAYFFTNDYFYRYHHAAWHVFSGVGSIIHFASIVAAMP